MAMIRVRGLPALLLLLSACSSGGAGTGGGGGGSAAADGFGAFTLEVLVRIDGVTTAALNQPRCLHIEATTGPARATMEARVTDASFYLDTFLLAGTVSRTLADSSKLHPVGQSTWTALTYDGVTMRHFVDGVEDANGAVAVPAFGPGKLSLGVRQNLMYWFAGCIRELRVTAAPLAPDQLQRAL